MPTSRTASFSKDFSRKRAPAEASARRGSPDSPRSGATWQKAKLDKPANPHAWQRWRADVAVPEAGYYEVWARATDDAGISQPFAIDWNPKGYLNNTFHRIAVTVA